MHLLEVELLSDDPAQTEAFYHTSLGLEVRHRSPGELALTAGASTLRFKKSLQQRPVYHIAFTIPCNKLREAQQWLHGRQPECLITPLGQREDFRNWQAEAIYFFDNNGNVLELIARAGLDNPSTEPFDQRSILSLSEVGLVVENVGAQADALIARYGLAEFVRQPRLPGFAALGDDHGLFILSSARRHWYPTRVPAQPFPLKVFFEEGGAVWEGSFPGL